MHPDDQNMKHAFVFLVFFCVNHFESEIQVWLQPLETEDILVCGAEQQQLLLPVNATQQQTGGYIKAHNCLN